MPAHRPRILVVDDEQVIADTLARILDLNGYEAMAVYSSSAALEIARTLLPDLVILDVIFPGDISGIDAAIRIRESMPSCKVLLFSGQAATSDLLEKARAQGYDFEILAKPVHPAELLARLER